MSSPNKTSKKGSSSKNQKPKSKPLIVSSVSEFLEAINKIIGDKNESEFLFRGQENETWKVETSAYRRLKTEPWHTEADELHYNLGLIEQFKHEDFHSDYKSKIMQLDLGILAQLQHNGAATSLIDFSSNPLVALWFACKKIMEPGSNGKVFILPTGGESKFEEINSFKEIENSKVKVLEQINFYQGNNILNNKKFLYWKPAHLNNRITAQQSYFLIGRREIPGMQELVIKEDCKKIILKNLSSVHRIERKTLFPDLAGFVQANSVSSSYGKKEKLVSDRIIIQHYDEIVEQNTEDISSYNKRGAMLFNLGYYKRAIDDFNKAIEINPNNADIYYNRGIAKNELDDYKGAIDNYNKAIQINPNYANAYNNRGNAKLILKNYKEAIDDCNKAIEIDPTNAYPYYNIGNAKYKLKDYKGAIDDYQIALKLSKNKNLTESTIRALKEGEAKLKKSQEKLSKDKE